MITFRQLGLHGQMGNQLFQYAMLKGVAAKTGFSVVIPDRFKRTDESLDGRYSWSSLEPFQLDCRVEPVNYLRALPLQVYKEINFEFSPGVFSVSDDTDFFGFFQSPKYFAHIEDQIRKEFQLESSIEQEAMELIEDYRKLHSSLVSLHVRLADNVNSDRRGYNYLVRLPYYKRAVKCFPNSKFIIFSDNPWICRRAFDAPQFVIHERRSQWVDLMAMSLCDHHICAASTFSWWASWLDVKKSAITVVPDKWFGRLNPYKISDLVLPHWVQMSDD